MLDSLTVPAWVARILRQLAQAEFIELALVVLNAEPSLPEPRFARLRAPRRHHLLFNLYTRIDARLFRQELDALADVDMAAELERVPVLAVVPRRPKRFEHRFPANALQRLGEADLDVLLRFGFNILRGEILRCARYGVWSFHHGDNRQYRGTPAFFWEMYEGNSVSGTTLQLLTEELDAGRILYRSFSATDPTSLHRSRNAAYWKSAEFVIRRLTDLRRWGWEYLESRCEDDAAQPYDKGIYRTPTNRQMVRFLARLLLGMASRQARKLVFRDVWHVGYRRVADGRAAIPHRTVAGAGSRSESFRLVASPPGRYYADPFVVEYEGRYHLFFEDYGLAAGKGVISSTCFDEHGVPNPAQLALERPYHLSYPFVFRWNGDWYMVPETREQLTIELFKAAEFPRGWALERVLLRDVNAVDPTIVEHHGRLWLFANVAVPGASIADELFLFHADSLLGEWVPHAMNPIVSDVRRARPAGRVMLHDGTLIRPSQDCSRRYGFATVLNRITRLTTTEYEETPMGRLEPGWTRGNPATHTFNAEGEYEVVDAHCRAVRLPAPLTHRSSRHLSTAIQFSPTGCRRCIHLR
jgi:hypothetical protein